MDLDSFISLHSGQWMRLEQLTRKRRLSGAETDELIRLYQRAATQLAQVRSAAPDPALITRLSSTLADARARIAGAHDPSWRDVTRFFTVVLPIAFYRIRWWSLAVSLVCLLIATVTGFWVATHPDAQAFMGTPNEIQHYVDETFEAYYSQYPHGSFAAQVWTNNAWIAAETIATGITGVLPALILFENSVSIGAAGGVMCDHGAAVPFFSLILPHGMLELSAVFVAGAAGLRLFWTWLVPGPRSRGRALAEQGRATFTLVLGLALVLAISGLIEGFVTPSGLPTWAKIAIGGLAAGAFWWFSFVPGKWALAAGHTADLRQDQAEDDVAVVG